MSLRERDILEMFVRTHGLLKQNVKKWKFAYETNKTHISGVTDPMTNGQFHKYMTETTSGGSWLEWKLDGTEIDGEE